MAKMRINNKEIEDAEVFETIVEHFPDIIHSVDNEGNILFTNRQASRLLGYSRKELLSMNIRQIYPDEILDKVEAVTADDLRDLANSLFERDQLALAILGPVTNKKPFEDILRV